MQREIEEDLEVEDFVRVLSVKLSVPSSFLVTVSSLSASSAVSSPVSCRKMWLVEMNWRFHRSHGHWYNWAVNAGYLSMGTVLLRDVLMIQNTLFKKCLRLPLLTVFISEMSYWFGCKQASPLTRMADTWIDCGALMKFFSDPTLHAILLLSISRSVLYWPENIARNIWSKDESTFC